MASSPVAAAASGLAVATRGSNQFSSDHGSTTLVFPLGTPAYLQPRGSPLGSSLRRNIMSTGPAKQDRPAEMPAGDATGVFVPPTSDLPSQPLPSSAGPAPEALAEGATGTFLPVP